MLYRAALALAALTLISLPLATFAGLGDARPTVGAAAH